MELFIISQKVMNFPEKTSESFTKDQFLKKVTQRPLKSAQYIISI